MRECISLSHLVLLILSVASGCASYQQKDRRPERHLIPEGYFGWVRIDFDIEDAPQLPVEDGFHVFKFPSSGHIKTSTKNEYGWASDEYYYYSDSSRTRLASTGWGGGGMIWGQSNGWTGTTYKERTATYEHFFVGTEEQFKKFAGLRNEYGLPRVENLNADDAPPPPEPIDFIPEKN